MFPISRSPACDFPHRFRRDILRQEPLYLILLTTFPPVACPPSSGTILSCGPIKGIKASLAQGSPLRPCCAVLGQGWQLPSQWLKHRPGNQGTGNRLFGPCQMVSYRPETQNHSILSTQFQNNLIQPTSNEPFHNATPYPFKTTSSDHPSDFESVQFVPRIKNCSSQTFYPNSEEPKKRKGYTAIY